MKTPDPPPTRLAVLRYGTPDFAVIEPGDHVLCAITFRPIPLEALEYWSVAAQEPYAGAVEAAEAVARRGNGRQ
ncbi:DUF2093 domain-containing protein [Pseudoroseomonas globiformis]|uniref:DUF2093 domain-containing protein n=1 Tax=Teichococcus globiformis TaxID=2307229 RepID=A0ABV7G0D6_9PROT